MKKFTSILALIMAVLMVFTACGKSEETAAEATASESTEASSEESTEDSDSSAFDYSVYIDEDGRWKGVTATDCVDMGEYKNLTLTGVIPTEDEIVEEIDSILADNAVESYDLDNAVEEGDTVNIDYVGSIDGVEFEGGNTNGNGANVTAGSTDYIDDFLTQIIGHKPGETFDVEVTFPEDYGNEELNGKDAVFVTTINYIIDTTPLTYTDADIENYLSDEYGVSTTDELYAYVEDYLTTNNVYDAIEDAIFANFSCKSIPDILTEFQQESMKAYYENYASYYGVDLETFLTSYVGVESLEALYETYENDMVNSSNYYLFMQSIIETEGIEISDTDVTEFLTEQVGEDQVDTYISYYGSNYMKMLVAQNRVYDLIRETAALE